MFLKHTVPTVIDDYKARGLAIPTTLNIQSDRGPDVYNRCWLALEEWLILYGLFQHVRHSALPVKHSHDVRYRVYVPPPFFMHDVRYLKGCFHSLHYPTFCKEWKHPLM